MRLNGDKPARPANLIALELPLLELGAVACKLFVRLKNVKTNASRHAIERRQMTARPANLIALELPLLKLGAPCDALVQTLQYAPASTRS
jgi:hypothetical protein